MVTENLNYIIAGQEPKFDHDMSKIELSQALNWYSQNKTSKDSVKYIHTFFKKVHKLDLNLEHHKNQPTTFGYVCKIVLNGGYLPPENRSWFNEQVDEVLKNFNTKKKKTIQPTTEIEKPNIQDRIQESVSDILGQFEGSVDDYILSSFKTVPVPKAILHDKAKGVHARKIIDWAKKRKTEFEEVYTTEDKYIIEGYSNFSRLQIRRLIAYFQLIIQECSDIIGTSVKTRKPKKKKEKTQDQIVSKIKVCKEFPELNLKSLPPKDILGASQVWVYNTKYKKLGVYNASIGGLYVIGASITNFDETKSTQKIVRKPLLTLPEVLKSSKTALKGFMTTIKSTENPLSGRLGEDTVILKVFK
jgi:hypothetical protein